MLFSQGVMFMLLCCLPFYSYAQDTRSFKIFQFPPNLIPSMDGHTNDWDIVGDDYSIGMANLFDDRIDGNHLKADSNNLDVKVKVGWVKGMNRLYFLYEAYDNYWDFSLPDIHNDIFEVVVDADQSGGPFIQPFHPNKSLGTMEGYFSFQGVHAQNYHLFTPALGKDWAMVWGSQSWLKELPYANAFYNYTFNPGEAGRLIFEFWITPFDYASTEGPSRSVESVLSENENIGLSWAIIDYDDVDKRDGKNNGFWNLSKERKMYGNASYLLPFKLMPIESQYLKPIDAKWTFKIIDMNRRLVSFKDESIGIINSWNWDFGDGKTSRKQHPDHMYSKPGQYIVILWIEGPSGKSRMAKVWDVAVK